MKHNYLCIVGSIIGTLILIPVILACLCVIILGFNWLMTTFPILLWLFCTIVLILFFTVIYIILHTHCKDFWAKRRNNANNK